MKPFFQLGRKVVLLGSDKMLVALPALSKAGYAPLPATSGIGVEVMKITKRGSVGHCVVEDTAEAWMVTPLYFEPNTVFNPTRYDFNKQVRVPK